MLNYALGRIINSTQYVRLRGCAPVIQFIYKLILFTFAHLDFLNEIRAI